MRGWMGWALLVLVLLILAAPIVTYPLGRDQGEFAIIGMTILRGGVPYVDVWNPKPPAIFYTYATLIQLFGQTVWGLRLLDLFLFPIMAAALYDIGRRTDSPTLGLWAVLLYGVFYFTETFWTLTQNDGVAALPMALAVWSVMVLLDTADNQPRRQIALAFFAGMMSATALWFKYPYLFFVIALVIGTAWARGWRWRDVISFSLGGLLIGLGGMGYLASVGAFGAWIESIRVTTGYTAQGYSGGAIWQDFRVALGYRWAHWHVLWVLLGIGILLNFGAKIQQPHNNFSFLSNRTMTNQPKWRIIILWLMGTAASLLIQAKGYDYHWLPMLPSIVLLAGYTATALTHLVEQSLGRGVFVWGIGGFVLLVLLGWRVWGTALPYLIGQQDQTTYAAQFIGGEFVASDSLELAATIKATVPRESTLFVWGFRPEIYYLTGTRPATRFIFQFPLVADWYPSAWRDEAVQTLWASLPPVVVVVRGDYMPWVTGVDADSNTLLQDFTELNNWLMFNYEPTDEVGSFIVWQRRTN